MRDMEYQLTNYRNGLSNYFALVDSILSIIEAMMLSSKLSKFPCIGFELSINFFIFCLQILIQSVTNLEPLDAEIKYERKVEFENYYS